MARLLKGLRIEAANGAISRFPRRNSGLYVKYEICRLSCQASLPISLPQRKTLSISFITSCVAHAVLFCFCHYTNKGTPVVPASAPSSRWCILPLSEVKETFPTRRSSPSRSQSDELSALTIPSFPRPTSGSGLLLNDNPWTGHPTCEPVQVLNIQYNRLSYNIKDMLI